MKNMSNQPSGVPASGVSTDPVAVNPQEPVVTHVTEQVVSLAEHETALAAARTAEKNKLYGTIEKQKTELAAQKAEVERLQKEARDRELAAMEPNQRLEAIIQEQAGLIGQLRTTLQSQESHFTKELSKIQLSSVYTSLLNTYNGKLIPELVTGTTEQELRDSAAASHQRWNELFAAHVPQIQVTPPAAQVPQAPVAAAAAPPVYAAPAATQNPAAPVAFAPIANAPQLAPADAVPQLNLNYLTSEQAIRSGDWAKYREQAFAGMRSNYQAPQPPHPVQNSPMPYAPLPGGVMSPTGIPSAIRQPAAPAPNAQLAAPPQFQSSMLPQFQQPVQQVLPPAAPPAGSAPAPMVDAGAEARAAVQRIRNGQVANPQAQSILSDVSGIVADANQLTRNTGLTAEAAFNTRFA